MRSWGLAAGVAALAMGMAAMGAGSARAADFTLNFTGVSGDIFLSSFDSGGTHFDAGSLGLSSGDLPITVSQGDTITAFLTLDAPLTVPQSVSITSIALDLFGNDFPSGDVVTTNNTVDFFIGGLGGSSVLSGSGFSTGTAGALIEGVDFFPPNNAAFTFDAAQFSFTIDTLSGPATLENAQFAYENFDGPAVPEPSAWALMLLGFAGLGAALRARRQAQVLA
ncbi:MAG: PEPxxWA-CTERM sorting domain-containing protein [Proteobacteria bacterium]|nr:PEPxxWA-CTERM sorting domain-containing protein [Pseudomonadota bacterium]